MSRCEHCTKGECNQCTATSGFAEILQSVLGGNPLHGGPFSPGECECYKLTPDLHKSMR